eukprot:CAMPEP_0183732536 /NCGR_PEP_ID=MMETSP0737-20130205/38660_1 /TAXON_ID=385413 /ORGANISM="Thalassiosira miniscula, Strain CCMP1093" /LENGTH=347 /DNA_ID=CAMNT_0025965565 /DNA_START=104 /DNA_END=1144 /DNA_ORIENTATION=+
MKLSVILHKTHRFLTGSPYIYKGQPWYDIPIDVSSVEFAPSVKEVPERTFQKCRRLKYVKFNEGLETIGQYAFFFCRSLRKIELPSSVVEIGRSAFGFCESLRYVVLNEGLEKICDEAFFCCKWLETIELPPSVTVIGHYAFGKCLCLRDVKFNEGLLTISWGAFYRCDSLESINLPSTVTEVGIISFNQCYALREVVLNETPKWVFDSAFLDCPSLETIKFPFVPMRLEAISCEGHKNAILNKIKQFPGMSMVDGEMTISPEEFDGGKGWRDCKERLVKIRDLIAYYQFKEATTIFQLAIWKTKLAEADIVEDGNRESCLVGVPGPVAEAVLQYYIRPRLPPRWLW